MQTVSDSDNSYPSEMHFYLRLHQILADAIINDRPGMGIATRLLLLSARSLGRLLAFRTMFWDLATANRILYLRFHDDYKGAIKLAVERSQVLRSRKAELDLAELYAFAGDFDNAKKICFAESSAHKEPNLHDQLSELIARASVYSQARNWSKTLQYNQQALVIAIKLQNKNDVEQISLHLAITLSRLHQFDEADKIFEKLALNEEFLEYCMLGALTLHNLDKGDIAQAEKFSNRNRELLKPQMTAAAAFYSEYFVGRALLEFEAKRFEEAEKYFRYAISRIQNGSGVDHPILLLLLPKFRDLLSETDREDEAQKVQKQIDLINSKFEFEQNFARG